MSFCLHLNPLLRPWPFRNTSPSVEGEGRSFSFHPLPLLDGEKVNCKPSIPPPRNKPIERALKFSLLLLFLFSRSTSTKWQRCVVFWRAFSSHRKAVQTGIWTRTSCTPSSVPHSSSHSCGVSVVIWSRLPWMHLTHLPGICSPTQTMLRWSSYIQTTRYFLLFVCLFVCSLVLPRHWNNYNVLMV